MLDKNVIEGLLDGDLFLVDVSRNGDDYEVVIDSDERVSVEDCIRLTKAIEAKYDRDVQDYSLTVTSAGIGEPLVHERQFAKLLQKQVEVVFVSGKKRVGRLDGRDEKNLILDGEAIPADEIKAVKEHITFS